MFHQSFYVDCMQSCSQMLMLSLTKSESEKPGGVAESHWARLSVTTVGNGGASLRASQFFWTIFLGAGVAGGYWAGSFETFDYQKISFSTLATPFHPLPP